MTFRAIGGLGNQLFVLAAALAYGEEFQTKVAIDMRRAARGKERGGPHSQDSSLLSLQLDGQPLSNFAADNLSSFFMDHFGSLELRVFRSISNSMQSVWCHTSAAAGFDAKVLEKPNIRYSKGYFQSFKYLKRIKQAGRDFNLSLIDPSSTYLEMKNHIGSGPYTVVHVRRGDYVTVAPNFGLLDAKYYARGLGVLASKASLGKVLVFSDNPRISEDNALRNVFESYDAEFVETSHLDPAETLMLMANGTNFIIANSSFSWWGAALSGTHNVVYPEPWFRSEPQPDDLNPPCWKPVVSSWLD